MKLQRIVLFGLVLSLASFEVSFAMRRSPERGGGQPAQQPGGRAPSPEGRKRGRSPDARPGQSFVAPTQNFGGGRRSPEHRPATNYVPPVPNYGRARSPEHNAHSSRPSYTHPVTYQQPAYRPPVTYYESSVHVVHRPNRLVDNEPSVVFVDRSSPFIDVRFLGSDFVVRSLPNPRRGIAAYARAVMDQRFEMRLSELPEVQQALLGLNSITVERFGFSEFTRAALNEQGPDGRTALHRAVLMPGLTEGQRERLVAALIDEGADPMIRDVFDLTPVHYAIAKNYRLVVLLLQQRLGDRFYTISCHGSELQDFAVGLGLTAGLLALFTR